jgi:translocator protein
MRNDRMWRWVNVLAVIVTIAVNGLANALPLNGLNTGEISDRFQVYFVPAGYVFSIWGLIYLGLIGFAVYQVLPGQAINPRLARVGPLFALSCLANIVWLFLWHYEVFPLTVVAMLVLLGSLIAIYERLGVGRALVSSGERWLVHLTFSVYLGWVSVATLANVTSVLDYVKWSGWGLSGALWAVILLAVAAALAILMRLRRGDVAYGLVVVWAAVGIAVSQSDTPFVMIAAILAALAMAAFLVYAQMRKLGPIPRRYA